ncbi:MAG TPA: GNAT family N-acetyltransferase [Anaeromyxobacter sp.]|nr:GNAT family N-acetyltransferase [Anaeromyxobacter sp.]
MDVRTMKAEDLDQVGELSAQLGYPIAAAELAANQRRLGGDQDHCLLVASEGERILGWVHAHGVRLVFYRPFAEVGGIVVEARSRKRGVGAALMDGAETWARRMGYREVRLRSAVEREDAHGFYQHLGYRRVRSHHTFAKDLWPTLGGS